MDGTSPDSGRELLLTLADGSVGLVGRAFLEAPREPGQPPAIEEVAYFILRARERTDLVDKVKAAIEREGKETRTPPPFR